MTGMVLSPHLLFFRLFLYEASGYNAEKGCLKISHSTGLLLFVAMPCSREEHALGIFPHILRIFRRGSVVFLGVDEID